MRLCKFVRMWVCAPLSELHACGCEYMEMFLCACWHVYSSVIQLSLKAAPHIHALLLLVAAAAAAACSWAFSIWGLIFALQGAGVLYAALPLHYDSPAKRAAVNAIGKVQLTTWVALLPPLPHRMLHNESNCRGSLQ